MHRVPFRALATAHRAYQAIQGLHWTPPGIVHEPNPCEPDPIDGFSLYAVLGTYNEADVVEASVANAFTQGVERVLLVDNASTDDTVARAVAAGAELVETFATAEIQETVRILLMNAVVWRVSTESGARHIWWVWMDADEFLHGPGGLTLRQYLQGLDRRFRLVGADYFQHFPSTEPHSLPRFHPLDFQPLAEAHRGGAMPRCPLAHFKHPLQRFDRDGPFITATSGFHRATANDQAALVEPDAGVVGHHFQYRDEAVTRQRLAQVYGEGGRGDQSYRANWRTGFQRHQRVDAVYAQRWAEVDNQRRIRGHVGVSLRPWLEAAGQVEPARWYPASALAEALEQARRAGAATPVPPRPAERC